MSAGRVVVVTGGTGGIGRAIVEALCARGDRVAFTWRSDEDAARRLAEASGAHAFPCDLRDRARPLELVREVEAELGPVQALVSNAGLHRAALLAMTSDDAWDEMVDVNLGAAFRMARAVVPGMVTRRDGVIVAVSSLVAVAGLPGETAYGAAKAGLLGLVRSLAREIGPRGIRVNAVLPGVVRTPMTQELPEAAGAVLDGLRALPIGVSPGDVAGLVAFLISDAARSITGQGFVVDAGVSA